MASELEMLRTYEPVNYLIFSPTTCSGPGDILNGKNNTNDEKCLIHFYCLLFCIHPSPPKKCLLQISYLSHLKNLGNMTQNTKCWEVYLIRVERAISIYQQLVSNLLPKYQQFHMPDFSCREKKSKGEGGAVLNTEIVSSKGEEKGLGRTSLFESTNCSSRRSGFDFQHPYSTRCDSRSRRSDVRNLLGYQEPKRSTDMHADKIHM